MKYLAFVFVLLGLFSCKENPPEIPALGGGTESNRTVLIEEYTGVLCVSCPGGAEEIQNLLALHQENLVAVSIHSGFFSMPYPESLYDFRTDAGDAVSDLVGAPVFFPSATINRKTFDGQSGAQLGQLTWAGYINQELEEEPLLNISTNVSFDDNSRELIADVSIVPLVDIPSTTRISVMITEDDIVDYQLLPAEQGGKTSDYTHKHVLRDMMTAYTGDPIINTLSKGTPVNFSYTLTLPNEWKASDCHVVAFVHNADEVLQATEEKVE